MAMRRDPTRRSRNIGTAKQGHGQNNRLTIPAAYVAERRWEELVGATAQEVHLVHGRSMQFIFEALNPGYFHSCEVGMLRRVLDLFPSEDLKGLGAILLRQPTRKQIVLESSWGRLTYLANVGVGNEKPLYEGPLVTLEAQKIGTALIWPRSLGPNGQRELDRLREDGHSIEDDGRKFRISMSVESVRNTQLMRTFPHEIGHWVDFLQKVERPSNAEVEDREVLSDRYFQRPTVEREKFAHRYADDFRKANAEALKAILSGALL
jgi:hypothetical protein